MAWAVEDHVTDQFEDVPQPWKYPKQVQQTQDMQAPKLACPEQLSWPLKTLWPSSDLFLDLKRGLSRNSCLPLSGLGLLARAHHLH